MPDAQISGLGAKMCPKLNLLEYSNCLLAVVKITEKVIHSETSGALVNNSNCNLDTRE